MNSSTSKEVDRTDVLTFIASGPEANVQGTRILEAIAVFVLVFGFVLYVNMHWIFATTLLLPCVFVGWWLFRRFQNRSITLDYSTKEVVLKNMTCSKRFRQFSIREVTRIKFQDLIAVEQGNSEWCSARVRTRCGLFLVDSGIRDWKALIAVLVELSEQGERRSNRQTKFLLLLFLLFIIVPLGVVAALYFGEI